MEEKYDERVLVQSLQRAYQDGSVPFTAWPVHKIDL